MLCREDFGDNFRWGVAISAFQNEGAAHVDGKGLSIWDTFTANIENIKNKDVIGNAVNFYHSYKEDIALTKELGFDSFRFSISWPRILPNGTGRINPAGIAFYNKVIDSCLHAGLTPFVTIYHWDLPQILEDKGGWTNREIINWFLEYVEICISAFGNRVTNWIVMNEPMTFTGLGYYMAHHAPQRKGINNFLKAAHHAVLCMAQGGKLIRKMQPLATIGVGLSCSYVKPVNPLPRNRRAAKRMEAMLNRFFLEPLLGLGYPTDTIPALRIIRSFFKPGDKELLSFDFDFIGLQYYFRVVAKASLHPPVLFASEINPTIRKANLNAMNLDAYPKGLYKLLKFYGKYPQIKAIVISESGVCYPDYLVNRGVKDGRRAAYHQTMLKQVKKALKKGINIRGYFAWTLVDNFEWQEGYEPRFGLVYNDHITQERIIKYSGKWFQSFLKKPD